MGWKGGYGTYKMRPSWDVYGSGLMVLEGNKPLSRSTSPPKWQSPRRRAQSGVYTPPVLDFHLQKDGRYGLEVKRRSLSTKMLRSLPLVGLVYGLLPFLEKAAWDLVADPISMYPQAEGTYWNANWQRVCATSGTSSCYGNPITGFYSNNSSFCGLASHPGSWSSGVRPNIWLNIVRCDTGNSPWYARFWRRITPVTPATADRPVYWGPASGGKPIVFLPSEIAPAATPVGHPQPRPNNVPFRLRHKVREAHERLNPEAGSGYTPSPPAPPPPVILDFPRHELRPPGPGEREGKWWGKSLLWKAFRAALWSTEAKDVLVALADGLGYNKTIKVCKGGFCYYKRAYPKQPLAKFIYNRWMHATPAELKQAIANVIANEIEDRLIARYLGGRYQLADGTVFRQFGNSWINARF